MTRTSNGWLLLRRPAYWVQLAREVPEGPIRRLEAAASSPSGPTLEDYAAFAGPLSPIQGENVDADRLAMDAPDENLRTNLPFLRLWNALSASARKEAESGGGASVAALDGASQALYRACLVASLNDVWRLDVLAYALPGGPPLPRDLRVSVRRYAPPRDRIDFPFVAAALGSPTVSLATYNVPFGPSKP